MPETSLDDLLTTTDVATRLGVSRRTVLHWASTGRLRPVLVGRGRTGTKWFDPADVADLEKELGR